MMGMAEGKNDDDVGSDRESNAKEEEAPYEFSLDPDTRAAEKKIRRVVAKQVRSSVRRSSKD